MDAGHDEYWTDSQVANVEAAENAGVNLAFLSGNEVFWQTRLSPSLDSTADPNRTLVSYKDTHFNQEIDPSGTATGTFQDPRFGTAPDAVERPDGHAVPGRSDQRQRGDHDPIRRNASYDSGAIPASPDGAGQHGVAGAQPARLRVGLVAGQRVHAGRPDRLSSTTIAGEQPNSTPIGAASTPRGRQPTILVEYRDPTSGALVFGAGTVFWSWGLSNQHDNSPSPFYVEYAGPERPAGDCEPARGHGGPATDAAGEPRHRQPIDRHDTARIPASPSFRAPTL